MGITIINKPSRKRITYNELQEGYAISKHYGMTMKETEVAMRDHIQDAPVQEMRDIYGSYFSKKEDK